MKLWRIAAICVALSAPVLQAQELSDAAKAALTQRVEAYIADTAAGDMGAVLDYLPPKVITALAAQSGMDEATMLKTVKDQASAVMGMVTVDSFSMDTDTATYQMTPDGSTGYVLIPTESIITLESLGAIKATSETVAFEEAGEWYLVRIAEPGLAELLQAVYPAFAGVTFKPGRMEVVPK